MNAEPGQTQLHTINIKPQKQQQQRLCSSTVNSPNPPPHKLQRAHSTTSPSLHAINSESMPPNSMVLLQSANNPFPSLPCRAHKPPQTPTAINSNTTAPKIPVLPPPPPPKEEAPFSNPLSDGDGVIAALGPMLGLVSASVDVVGRIGLVGLVRREVRVRDV